MVCNFYRCCFVLLGLSPVSIGFFCGGAQNFKEAAIGLSLGLVLICASIYLFKKWIQYVSSHIISDCAVCQIQTIAERRNASSTYFLTYVLPLMQGSQINTGLAVVIVITFALACLVNESVDSNPLAHLIGYHFYDVTSANGQTFLVMSKKSMQELCSVKRESPTIFGLQVDSSFVISKE